MGKLSWFQHFFIEVRRRKVFRVAVVYLACAWGASLGASELFPNFGIPPWVVRAFVIGAILGFPVALVLAWAFEITPDGVVWDSDARKQEEQDSEEGFPDDQDGHLATTRVVGPSLKVRWTDAGGTHQEEFGQGFDIGRDHSVQLRFDDPMVSRAHARVSLEGGRWWIVDLSSRNGTQLNGDLITEKTQLSEHQRIRLYEEGPLIELTIGAAVDDTMLAQSPRHLS